MNCYTEPAEAEAANLTFGIEIKIKLPRTVNVAVGLYNIGVPVNGSHDYAFPGALG